MSLDIVIAGGGLAGLATAYYLKKHAPNLRVKIIEQRNTYSQDKHWSFWLENNADFDFSHIIHQRYTKWSVGINEQAICSSKRFAYAVIRSADWYAEVMSVIGDIVEFNATCAGVNYQAPMVINALPPVCLTPSLYQQFKGFVVEVEAPGFEADCATLMDFSIVRPQGENAACGFMYMLPFGTHRALIEPTLFTKNVVAEEWFEDALASYMAKKHIKNWRVKETEFGLLPLGVAQAEADFGFPIGMRAGWLRPSTGYAFLNSLRLAELLAKEVAANGKLPTKPLQPYSSTAAWMDKIFLKVMQQSPHLLPEIFSNWFKHLPADDMVQFLQDSATHLITARVVLNAAHKTQFIRQLWTR